MPSTAVELLRPRLIKGVSPESLSELSLISEPFFMMPKIKISKYFRISDNIEQTKFSGQNLSKNDQNSQLEDKI